MSSASTWDGFLPSRTVVAARRPGAPAATDVQSLAEIRAELGDCKRCKLHASRTNLVFGEGDPRARLMFVGEGPGEQEDLEGRPFVGRSGQLLEKMIEAMGLQRSAVFIANVVKSRPPGNRNPEPDEIAACEPFLFKQIDAIQPEVVVALGKFAAQTLLKTEVRISDLRGRFHPWRGRLLMPTWHPAYLLRNPPSKREAWEDLKLVAAQLGLEIPHSSEPLMIFGPFFMLVLIALALAASSLKVLNEYERGVVFRLGRIVGARGPGLVIIIPLVDRMVRVDLRTVTLDVPPQDCISRDNVTVKVNAVIYFRVVEPNRAVVEVENYLLATSKLAQTTLRSVLGQVELDELLAAREAINQRLASILDAQTGPWGVKVTAVEVKQIDLPVEMQRAMAKQAEAERERRAKIIAADAELQASEKLSEAARIMSVNPVTIQLRYLQTLQELSSKQGASTIIPFPVDIFRGLGGKA